MCLFVACTRTNEAANKRPARPEQVLARAKQVEKLKQDGAAARAFRLEHPGDDKAGQALHDETKNDLLAGLLSDDRVEPEVIDAAKQASHDPALTEAQRLDLASLVEVAGRKNQKFPNRAAWVNSCEESARRLMAEHPDAPGVYQNLLEVAAMNHGAKRAALAQEIVDSNAAPETKEAARVLLIRESIGGSSLASVLGNAPGSTSLLKLAHDQPVVLYTWRPEDQRSVARAQAIAAQLPQHVAAIGINLSRDTAAAVTMATDKKLPGAQLTGGRGYDHPVTLRLGLTSPSLMYLIGRDGIVRNLSEETNLADAFARLN